MGTVAEEVNQQTWLVEGTTSRRSPVAVARALVEPRGGKVTLRLLNPSLDPVTVRAGTEVADLELVDQTQLELVAAVDSGAVTPQKEEMLWELAEKSGQKGKKRSSSH